jgi:hypothetical protein
MTKYSPGGCERPSLLHLYHLMQAYRANGYYSKNIQDSDHFLCSHTDFLVLSTDEHTWFNLTIKPNPLFEWKVLESFNALGVNRDLIMVHRKAALAFCDQTRQN